MDTVRSYELLLQALETELRGVAVYDAAIRCAVDPALRDEWARHLGQAREHVGVVRGLFANLGLDPEKETPGRSLVRARGLTLVAAVDAARRSSDPVFAQIVAAECVVDAQSKDHANWSLLGELMGAAERPWRAALSAAHDEVEAEHDEHLDRAERWCRALWIRALGLEAELPSAERAGPAASPVRPARTRRNGPA